MRVCKLAAICGGLLIWFSCGEHENRTYRVADSSERDRRAFHIDDDAHDRIGFHTLSDRDMNNICDLIDSVYGGMNGTYDCTNMVRTVNSLRNIGKQNALYILEQYLRVSPGDFERNFRVAMICRCLFFAPGGGWPLPSLGSPEPDVIGESQFPSFPIHIVQQTPFLLIRSYTLGGLTFAGYESLETAKHLKLAGEKLSTDRAASAARDLISSRQFRNLYKSVEAQNYMKSDIQAQISHATTDGFTARGGR